MIQALQMSLSDVQRKVRDARVARSRDAREAPARAQYVGYDVLAAPLRRLHGKQLGGEGPYCDLIRELQQLHRRVARGRGLGVAERELSSQEAAWGRLPSV